MILVPGAGSSSAPDAGLVKINRNAFYSRLVSLSIYLIFLLIAASGWTDLFYVEKAFTKSRDSGLEPRALYHFELPYFWKIIGLHTNASDIRRYHSIIDHSRSVNLVDHKGIKSI